jgi:large subunit ribosomal protein L21
VFAIIESGGKQHRVAVGDVLDVELLGAEAGSTVEIDRVLLVADGATVTAGRPTVADARVVSTVLGESKGPKLIVFKYKSKKRVRKKTGHRQHYTRLRIDDIVVGGVSAKPRPAPEATATPEAKAPAPPTEQDEQPPTAEPEA